MALAISSRRDLRDGRGAGGGAVRGLLHLGRDVVESGLSGLGVLDLADPVQTTADATFVTQRQLGEAGTQAGRCTHLVTSLTACTNELFPRPAGIGTQRAQLISA
jgi:hypothetical protein